MSVQLFYLVYDRENETHVTNRFALTLIQGPVIFCSSLTEANVYICRGLPSTTEYLIYKKC